ncbi:cupredoxin domain-containing protein [Nitrospira sp. NS4]|uniref:cupredoxin domain-containing protein n=1 Tax=Nitrospira sp. NS4 TaxID=3414498 RepID=UPI003C2C6D36
MSSFRLMYLAGLLLAMQLSSALAADAPSLGPPFVVPVDADGVQRATVTLDSYSYSPNHLVVQSGKPVELTLTSVTTITPHNFVIKELSVEQDVGAGKTVTIKFTPTQPGVFPIYCDKRLWPLPSHRDKGMEGRLEVKP